MINFIVNKICNLLGLKDNHGLIAGDCISVPIGDVIMNYTYDINGEQQKFTVIDVSDNSFTFEAK